MKEAGEFCYENVKFGFPSKYQGVKKDSLDMGVRS